MTKSQFLETLHGFEYDEQVVNAQETANEILREALSSQKAAIELQDKEWKGHHALRAMAASYLLRSQLQENNVHVAFDANDDFWVCSCGLITEAFWLDSDQFFYAPGHIDGQSLEATTFFTAGLNRNGNRAPDAYYFCQACGPVETAIILPGDKIAPRELLETFAAAHTCK